MNSHSFWASSRLVMFAKAPVPGRVKTRLQPPLTPEQAAELHASFLLDQTHGILLKARDLGIAQVCLSAAGDRDHPIFQEIEEAGVTILPQRGTDLGDRMATAIEEGLNAGFSSVTLIGSDSPTLPVSLLRDAVACLERGAHVALGPSFDGGFTSISARTPVPALRTPIPWSQPNTLARTCEALRAHKQVVELVGFWYDVDDELSMTFLVHHLLHALGEQADMLAPRTAQWLRAHPVWS